MSITLPELPYALTALAPHISAETLEYHYGKHHKTYVDKLNGLIAGTAFATQSLQEIIATASGPIFNNAAQIWNHNFYWQSLSPHGGGNPTAALAAAIDAAFGSFDEFKAKFSDSAVNNFGSGWTWLVKTKADGALSIVNTSNAATPFTNTSVTPILTVDIWEHAYYIDYRNARARYLDAFWKLVNWNFAGKNYRG